MPNPARNLAEAGFGRIWEKWPDIGFAGAGGKIRCNPSIMSLCSPTVHVYYSMYGALVAIDKSVLLMFVHRLDGHIDLSERLIECQYELTDGLAYYLCSRRPGQLLPYTSEQ